MSGDVIVGGVARGAVAADRARTNQSVGDIASRLSATQAEEAVRALVENYGTRPPAALELDAHDRAALIVLDVPESELQVRVAERRARLRDELRAVAREALDAPAKLDGLKTAWLAAHRACFGFKAARPAEQSEHCSSDCKRAHAVWRREVVLTRPAAAALERLRQLAVPREVKARETAARVAEGKARALVEEEARRLRAEQGLPSWHAGRLRVAQAVAAQAEAALARAVAEHEAAVAERQRLEVEATEEVRAAAVAAPAPKPKRRAS